MIQTSTTNNPRYRCIASSFSSTTTVSRKGTATSTTVAHRHGARFARRLRRSAIACGHWAHIWAAGARAWGGRWRSGNAALCSRRARRSGDGALDPLSIAPGDSVEAPTLAFMCGVTQSLAVPSFDCMQIRVADSACAPVLSRFWIVCAPGQLCLTFPMKI